MCELPSTFRRLLRPTIYSMVAGNRTRGSQRNELSVRCVAATYRSLARATK